MKTKFNDFINEYYSGGGAAIGFRYSDAVKEQKIEIIVFNKNLSDNELKLEIESNIKDLVDEAKVKVESLGVDVLDEISEYIDELKRRDQIQNNIIIQDLRNVIINTNMYSSNEANSLIRELVQKSKTETLFLPIYLINGEGENQLAFKAKTKIGFHGGERSKKNYR